MSRASGSCPRKGRYILGKLHPMVLMLSPNDPRWHQEFGISKTADRHPNMKGPHFKQPINRCPAIRTKMVGYGAPRLCSSAEGCILARDRNNSLAHVISPDAEYATSTTLTFGAVADRNKIGRPFGADPQTTTTTA